MRVRRFLLSALLSAGALSGTAMAQNPSAKDALQLKPLQSDVQYETPEASQQDSCTIKAEKFGGRNGWVVRDSAGQILRRFVDSNSDNVVDVWSYFQNGIEVYRDIDSNYNNKADQHRWLNTAGTRWAVDSNEDGKIDSWKAISPQEVSKELITAIAEVDAKRFENLLLSDAEISKLGLEQDKAKELSEQVKAAKAQFAQLARSQSKISRQTKWLNLGATQPGTVITGVDGAADGFNVYENTIAILEGGGQTSEINVGTIIQVGNVWKLIDLPQIDTENAVATGERGFFFRASGVMPNPQNTAIAGGISEEMQTLLTELEKLDRDAASATTTTAKASYHKQRTTVLKKLANIGETPEDKRQWLQQLADTVSAAVQSGEYPDGVAELDKLLSEIKSDKTLSAYVKFRKMTAEYGLSLSADNVDFAKVHSKWLEDLEAFIGEYPASPDAAEAMLQLAMAEEFAGQEDESTEWYQKITQQFPNTAAAKKAAGAVKRIKSVGQPLVLAGTSIDGKRIDLTTYRGRVVVLHYWATWCQPCINDMRIIKDLFAKYGRNGFSPIGVSLDYQKSQAEQFLTENRIAWPQIYEPGSLDGRMANELGILTLPTMMLIDDKGRVVNRNIHISELETELKKLIKED